MAPTAQRGFPTVKQSGPCADNPRCQLPLRPLGQQAEAGWLAVAAVPLRAPRPSAYEHIAAFLSFSPTIVSKAARQTHLHGRDWPVWKFASPSSRLRRSSRTSCGFGFVGSRACRSCATPAASHHRLASSCRTCRHHQLRGAGAAHCSCSRPGQWHQRPVDTTKQRIGTAAACPPSGRACSSRHRSQGSRAASRSRWRRKTAGRCGVCQCQRPLPSAYDSADNSRRDASTQADVAPRL